MKVEITERPGVCRWCGCTEWDGCAIGCSWANAKRTLCSACVNLEQMFKRVKARRELVQRIKEELGI